MRRLADRLGIRAPSLYKHLPNKAAVETAIIVDGFDEAAAAFEAATDGAANAAGGVRRRLPRLRLRPPARVPLMTEQPLPATSSPEGLEARAAAPLVRAVGQSRGAPAAAWAFIHGMRHARAQPLLPDDGMTELAWRDGLVAFAPG